MPNAILTLAEPLIHDPSVSVDIRCGRKALTVLSLLVGLSFTLIRDWKVPSGGSGKHLAGKPLAAEEPIMLRLKKGEPRPQKIFLDPLAGSDDPMYKDLHLRGGMFEESGNKANGVVTKWVPEKFFGFIKPDQPDENGSDDIVFFHKKALMDEEYGESIIEGDKVSYTPKMNERKGKSEASNVAFLAHGDPPPPPEESTGTLTRWLKDKGFGFIKPSDGGEELFCHATSLQDGEGSVQTGDEVGFQKFWDNAKQKYNCKAVRFISHPTDEPESLQEDGLESAAEKLSVTEAPEQEAEEGSAAAAAGVGAALQHALQQGSSAAADEEKPELT